MVESGKQKRKFHNRGMSPFCIVTRLVVCELLFEKIVSYLANAVVNPNPLYSWAVGSKRKYRTAARI